MVSCEKIATGTLSECLSLAESATVRVLNDEQYRKFANELKNYYENYKKIKDKCNDLEKKITLSARIPGTVSESNSGGELGYKKACVFCTDFWKTNEFWMNSSSIDSTLFESAWFLGHYVPRHPGDIILSEDANFAEKIYIKKNEIIRYGVWKNGAHEITMKKFGKEEDQQRILYHNYQSSERIEMEYSLFPNFHARIECNNKIAEHPELFIFEMNSAAAKFIYEISEFEVNVNIADQSKTIRTRIDLTSSLNPRISFYQDSILRCWKIEKGVFIIHKIGKKTMDYFVLNYDESAQLWRSNKIPDYFARNEPYRPLVKVKFNINSRKRSRRISKKYLR